MTKYRCLITKEKLNVQYALYRKGLGKLTEQILQGFLYKG